MTRKFKLPLFAFLFFAIFCTKAKANTFSAASCAQSAVQAAVNGASDGDTVIIPAGSCTWTSGVTVRSGIGISIIGNGIPNSGAGTTGAGTVNTILKGGQFTMNPTFGNSLSRISTINFLPGTAAPIAVNGTCATSGCPNLRLDNLIFPSSWAAVRLSDASVANVSNVFGVADHNTIGDVAPSTSYLDFLNLGNGSWQGVGNWGDNSWASPGTFGTAQTFYLENNVFNYSLGTDTDIGGSNGGGARFACRFNTFNNISFVGACSGHGTDTTGRARGVRQWEGYYNTGTCSSTTSGCPSAWPGRSGVGRSFGNSFTNVGGGFMTGITQLDPQRRWRPVAIWIACDGLGAFDTNDGTTYYSGTIGSVRGANNNYTIADSGSPGWTTNQWENVGSPYDFYDVTKNFGYEIGASTSNSVTTRDTGSNFSVNVPAPGDTYQILRSRVCLDQPARSGGQLVQGSNLSPVLVSTGNPGPVNQTLDPTYEADDTLPSTANGKATISSNTGSIIANRDFYVESVNQAAQTSPTSPFNGTSGSGHGILANRPTACTTGVGYWATDQGNWNTSGIGGQGELFVCTATNTWSLSYTPYTYPHPVTAGGTTGPPPAAPLGVTVTSIQ